MDATQIVQFITNIPYFLDIIIILFLLISTSMGFGKGVWRGLWRLIFVVLGLLISWYFLLTPMAEYVRDGLLKTLNIRFQLENGEFITSIGDLLKYEIQIQQSLGGEVDPRFLDPLYLDAFILSFCKSIAWILLVIIMECVSWIVSGLLYFLLVRLLIPAKAREHKIKFLGALCGLLQGVVVTFSMMIGFAAISPASRSIANAGQPNTPYGWLPESVRLVIESFDPNNSMLEPYVKDLESSMLESGFHEVPEGYEKTSTFQEDLELFFEQTSKMPGA